MKKRLICLLLALLLLISPTVLSAEGDGSRIITQIVNTYAAVRAEFGMSFNGYCGAYVRMTLDRLSIGYAAPTKYVGNGNMWYYVLTDSGVTPFGYRQVKYPGGGCLNDIVAANAGNVYNIVVSYPNSYSHTGGGSDPGHVVFIHAVLDGKVYYSESYSPEGEPRIKNVGEFNEEYTRLYGNAIGAVHFVKESNPPLSPSLVVNKALSSEGEHVGFAWTSVPCDYYELTITDSNGVAAVSGTDSDYVQLAQNSYPAALPKGEYNAAVFAVKDGLRSISNIVTVKVATVGQPLVVRFNRSELTLLPGSTFGLQYTTVPIGLTPDVSYITDRPEVASAEGGKVVAKSAGCAKISLVSGQAVLDSCDVTVVPVGTAAMLDALPDGYDANEFETVTRYRTASAVRSSAFIPEVLELYDTETVYSEWSDAVESDTFPQTGELICLAGSEIIYRYHHYNNYYNNRWNVDSIPYGTGNHYHTLTSKTVLPTSNLSDRGSAQSYGGRACDICVLCNTTGSTAMKWWFETGSSLTYYYRERTKSTAYIYMAYGSWADTPPEGDFQAIVKYEYQPAATFAEGDDIAAAEMAAGLGEYNGKYDINSDGKVDVLDAIGIAVIINKRGAE